jgi:DNA-binding transcriptional regulator YdaS (Cro superfamily)
MSALQRAIDAAGTQAALAGLVGVKQQHVWNWLNRGNTPAEHCPAIERATREIAAERGDPKLIVTCEELCPGVPWDVLREQAPTPPQVPTPTEAAEAR